ncbi:glutathione S-transferase [Rhodobacteraceae bacterium EhC02]|nr:glutathione S-transferase family protein [Paracoccaceae bacterium]OAN69962.1 glutathione S-transferase [Rhodobacteraceae bacterium EhC02]
MTHPYRLHYAPDNASLIVRLALEEMRLPYEAVLVDRRVAAQRSARYLALNPHGRIPVLETPDGAIFETGAILLWLADRHRTEACAMMPPCDHPDRTHALKWLFFLSNTLHAELRMLFYPALYVGDDPAHQAALRARLQGSLTTHLARLDTAAAAGHAWLNGAAPSILDYYLATCLRWIALYPVDLAGWRDRTATPHLEALCARIETRAATAICARAEGLGPHPFTQPAYPTPPEGSAL